MDSWPLHWQIIVTVVSAILAGGGVSALVSGLLNQPKTQAEARKTDAEAADIASDTAWETVKRLDNRLQTLEDRDEARQREYEQLRCEHEDLQRKYRRLLTKSQNQEQRILQLERELNASRARERVLCEMLERHGIDPDEEAGG